MTLRYIVEIKNSLISSVSQVAYVREDLLTTNQKVIYTDMSPTDLFNCIVEEDGSLIYLGDRGPYDVIDVENKRYKVDINLVYEGIRSRRNLLLQESDWTQLPDVPLPTKEAWATYRQALRDITNQPDPFNIVWPEPPQ